MGTDPEARRRLEQGLRRRVVERQEQCAANWQHAVQVGQALDLGEPLGIYHAEVIPALSARQVLRMLLPIPAFLLVVFLLMVCAPDAAIPILLVSPFLIGAYAVKCALVTRRGRFTRWLYGYAGGMAEVDPDGRPRVVRWDDVTDVVDEWGSAGSESQAVWSYEGFRLTTADGRTVSFTARYENALDPYGPAGGSIAAVTPAAVGDAIPRFLSLADLITGQAVTRVVARQVAAVRAGADFVRGDVRVTRDGIAGPKGAAITPWAAIERIELRPGRVKVRPIGGRARNYDNYRDGSGYAVLCRLLVALGVNASFEARG
ncbi:hypothetical protein [Actinoplanes aureus]|uniref:Uncharacterized protein n=1 Tax=Actinoplanes aureus TaxID=2792083 RepID=A0A931CLK7_9ACTN|nr:hypothetical protein [Actinoplanes aureus]MBG0568646.1 hypothetical protein [Actinoplanes aureus]